MKVLFIQEAKYLEYNNNLYSTRISYRTYWDRYLEYFESVTILARVKPIIIIPKDFIISTGSKVNYIPIKYYEGPIDFLKNIFIIEKQIKVAVKSDYVYILRVPSHIGILVYRELKNRKLNFVVEVVGDPYEVGQHLSLILPFRILYSFWMLNNMRSIVKNSVAVLYVTKFKLQRRYPSNKNAIQANASNVIIPDSFLISIEDVKFKNISTISSRLKTNNDKKIRLGVIGMLYSIKSPIEIVKAVNILLKKGLNIELIFVGDGPLLGTIKDLSTKYDISENIHCLGSLPSGASIFSFIDSLDIYIQFSKTEGLPRAMLEAMTRGCTVISSNVGGIGELLPNDMLIESRDIKALANKISWILNNPKRMKNTTLENINISKEYLASSLSEKRSVFFDKVNKLFIEKSN